MGWVLLALALACLVLASMQRRRTGLPWRRVVYQDSGWERNEQPLFAREYDLVGKPDYLLGARGAPIPVEVKPGRRAATPYQSDLMQLAAYCLLVEATTGHAPRYGLLRYATQTFRLRYTRAVRRDLLELMAAMQRDRAAADVGRSHVEQARCHGCGFSGLCSEALR